LMYSIKNEKVMTTQNGGSSHRCPMCALEPKRWALAFR
jgi:hypothetical protein